MPKRIAKSTLNASTIDIMNVIRQNASYEYQQNVPVVETWNDIPKVGEIIYGTPAFSNQFINALVNRIASVRVQSATFNNPYSILKKGYIEFGETIENIFVNIAKAVDYNPEKGAEREFKRTMPDIKSVFHTMNWRVMYPVTIQDEDLKLAFMSGEGVQNLITKIVDSVYTAAEYDEFLLFKYLLIKGISHGAFKTDYLGNASQIKVAGVRFRAVSNLLPFLSDKYNSAHVKTNTPKDRQIIFMDAAFNANYDVEILASAFNMDKADYMGRLFLIDNWTSFDNERFDVIRAASDGIEEVTPEELALMANVRAVLVDEDFFQVYDNNSKFTEDYVAAGLYWNYFYHQWKTVSYSPFANAVVFVLDTASTTVPNTITAKITTIDEDDNNFVVNFDISEVTDVNATPARFIETGANVSAGVAVQTYGSYIIPKSENVETVAIQTVFRNATYNGTLTVASMAIGDEITLTKA